MKEEQKWFQVKSFFSIFFFSILCLVAIFYVWKTSYLHSICSHSRLEHQRFISLQIQIMMRFSTEKIFSLLAKWQTGLLLHRIWPQNISTEDNTTLIFDLFIVLLANSKNIKKTDPFNGTSTWNITVSLYLQRHPSITNHYHNIPSLPNIMHVNVTLNQLHASHTQVTIMAAGRDNGCT